MTPIRLNKALADAGICSRRKADALIAAGKVYVNGQQVKELGLKVDLATDRVTVDGTELASQTQSTEQVYLLLHKPVQVVSTVSDPQGRTTVLDLLPEPFRTKRVYPVGRLDYFSEGLLLLTNDGELTQKLTHPRYQLEKEYEVLVREVPTRGMIAAMREGMTLKEGTKLLPVDAKVHIDNSHLLIVTLRQGVNRQIRRMCRDLGLTILRLRRVRMGKITLDLLPQGACRPLTKQEMSYLREAKQA